jgi:hypothetical protein
VFIVDGKNILIQGPDTLQTDVCEQVVRSVVNGQVCFVIYNISLLSSQFNIIFLIVVVFK